MPVILSEKSRKGRAARSDGIAVHSWRRTKARLHLVPDCPATIPAYLQVADVRAVVEVLPDRDGSPPEDLLRKSYEASQDGVIALALNGVTVAAVNRVMDGIVPHYPLSIPGVVYVDARDRSLLAWLLGKADLAVGQTREFRELVPISSVMLSPSLRGGFHLGSGRTVRVDLPLVFVSLRRRSSKALAAWIERFRFESGNESEVARNGSAIAAAPVLAAAARLPAN